MPAHEPPRSTPPIRTALAALARDPRVRYAELRYVAESSEKLLVRDLRPEQVATTRAAGVAVRVLGEKTWGFACTPTVDER